MQGSGNMFNLEVNGVRVAAMSTDKQRRMYALDVGPPTAITTVELCKRTEAGCATVLRSLGEEPPAATTPSSYSPWTRTGGCVWVPIARRHVCHSRSSHVARAAGAPH